MTRVIKRLTDIFLALAGLIVTAPVMLLVAIAIRIKMGSPVFYRQIRPGYHSKPFALVKFRSLREETVASDGQELTESDRTTSLTGILRSTSLDELPQLWNVLKGEMSLVGPRPLIFAYLERYTPEQARRHDMRPGMTGLAQINGRQTMDYEQRFKFDVWYVDHWSLWLDIKILLATVKIVFSRRVEASTDPDFSYPKWGEETPVRQTADES